MAMIVVTDILVFLVRRLNANPDHMESGGRKIQDMSPTDFLLDGLSKTLMRLYE